MDRARPVAAAHEGQEHSHEEDERDQETAPAPDGPRPDCRDGGECEGTRDVDGPGGEGRRDRDDGEADQADDLRARVEPVNRARRIAGEPGSVQGVVAESAHEAARERRAHEHDDRRSGERDEERADEAGDRRRDPRVVDPREGVVRDGRALLERVQVAVGEETFLLGDLLQTVGGRGRIRRGEHGQSDRDASARTRNTRPDSSHLRLPSGQAAAWSAQHR